MAKPTFTMHKVLCPYCKRYLRDSKAKDHIESKHPDKVEEFNQIYPTMQRFDYNMTEDEIIKMQVAGVVPEYVEERNDNKEQDNNKESIEKNNEIDSIKQLEFKVDELTKKVTVFMEEVNKKIDEIQSKEKDKELEDSKITVELGGDVKLNPDEGFVINF